MRWIVLVSGILFLSIGCSGAPKTVATPNDIGISPDFRIYGNVVYEGDRGFLPQHLKEKNSKSDIHLKYSYKAASTAVNSVQQPLGACSGGGCLYSMPAASMGQNDVSVVGTLEIVQGGQVIKKYTASDRAIQDRNSWDNPETVTQLKEKSLLAVRDKIDAQLQKDKKFLQQFN